MSQSIQKESSQQEDIQEPKIRFRIGSIRIVESHGTDIAPEPQAKTEYRFDVSVETGVEETQGLIIVMPTIKISMSNKPDEIIASLVVQFVFQCENLNEFIKDSTLTLPDQIWASFINIAIGTSRGMLFLKNTPYSYGTAILPPIDATTFIPRPIKIGDISAQRPFVIRGSIEPQLPPLFREGE